MQSSTAIAKAVSYPSLGALLGAYDQLAIEVSADRVEAGVGPVSLHVYLAHSGDGYVWDRKQPAPLTHTDNLSLTGKTYLDIGYDLGLIPSMAIVRLELTLQANGGPVSARVRVHVTANNVREREFSAAVMKTQQQAPSFNAYSRCYPSGSRISESAVKYLIEYWRHTNKLRYNHYAVVVPPDQMVCFNAYGDYILVERGKPVWSSRVYEEQLPGAQHWGPKRTAEDPKPTNATFVVEESPTQGATGQNEGED
ncbi:hypothetical protein BE21_18475 [Sorangium cellulosum]|uniref:Uncharacterized protein n=1 Tax=Sorangium cellulosum TaxID=56 RepID=A0A150TX80_SORCE|nr:hypothetical protein BE21_18475 [Sorangium cellulosum]